MRKLLVFLALVGLFAFPSPAIAANCQALGPNTSDVGNVWRIPPTEWPKFTSAILNAMNRLSSKDCEIWVALVSEIEITESGKVADFQIAVKDESGQMQPIGWVKLRQNDAEELLALRIMVGDEYEFAQPNVRIPGKHDA